MSSTNITLRDEAYNSLKSHQRDGESFSDTVLRLAEADKDVFEGFGMLSDTEADEVAEHIEEMDEEIDAAFTEGRDELLGQ